MNRLSGTIAKVRITIDPEFRPYVPVLIPDLDAVRALAEQVHHNSKRDLEKPLRPCVLASLR